MKTTNNTVLISGGSAGIGLEIAKLFSANGNKIIITGRNKERLDKALSQLNNATGIVSDVSDSKDTEALVETLVNDFPDLNIVINNAGQAYLYDVSNSAGAFEKAEDEILTNYLAVIRLNEKLLPLLKSRTEAAIVNVSSVVAFVPGSLATYSASKAALHSYSQSLRIALARTSDVKVFELMPPLVDTEFSAPINGKNGMAASAVASDFIEALQNDLYEIRVGNTQHIYDLYLSSPAEALNAMQPA
ncbi:SDR family oxidoreductase [Dyadobacter psychrotolerans]|uniref:SDR family NAD(P)-dependent oxidoreductase n=1 Tax=Dyadobacter psychrotolerans TaxID=2541721 RepID=A0A4R5DJ09_9BACT|nr:SDR family NAD(P)-dependent oxidoreductase [Dyadobacter psychrotolerans]TDE10513.1 SDR family NAD(P)-dependent oxidoreductase [Dyadobacter psychrotolerans]